MLKRHSSPNFLLLLLWGFFLSLSVAIKSEDVTCIESLEDSCCRGWFRSLSENHSLYIHIWNSYSRSPGSTAESLVSEMPKCKWMLEPLESPVLRW